jgi:uncharacterized protein
MTTIAIGIGIGIAAGVLSGLFGVGGGILIVPSLVFLGLTQREASGTSLAALLVPVGILGVIEYAKRHEVRPLYAIGIAIGLTAGAFVGAVLAGKASNQLLQRLFGALMIIAGLRFVLFAR